MRAAPLYIVEKIRNYDPLLRLRWSKEKLAFVLERKAERRFIPPPVIYRHGDGGKLLEIRAPELSERYIAYHDGYLPIMTIKRIGERFIRYLYDSDARRKGKNYIKALEEAEAKREMMQEKSHREGFRDISGEAYDHLKWMSGERMALSGVGGN